MLHSHTLFLTKMSTSANSIRKQLATFSYNNRATNSVHIIHFCLFFKDALVSGSVGRFPPFLLFRASFSVDVLAFIVFFFHLLFHAAETLFPIKACDPTTTKASHSGTGGTWWRSRERLEVMWLRLDEGGKAHPQEPTSANDHVNPPPPPPPKKKVFFERRSATHTGFWLPIHLDGGPSYLVLPSLLTASLHCRNLTMPPDHIKVSCANCYPSSGPSYFSRPRLETFLMRLATAARCLPACGLM